jgi:hypothetical protein
MSAEPADETGMASLAQGGATQTEPTNPFGETGPLGRLFEAYRASNGRRTKRGTFRPLAVNKAVVMAPQNDPYAIDSPLNRVYGQWFAEEFSRIGRQRIHIRGVHYALIGREMTDGKIYVNDDRTWHWIGSIAKLARWLKFVPFNAIVDERSDAPEIKIRDTEASKPSPYFGFQDCDMYAPQVPEVPDVPDIDVSLAFRPYIGVLGAWHIEQKYRLVFYSEKTSAGHVLRPLGREFDADLFLETGEISDAHIYMMAEAGANDGREMVVITFSDCDPSGHQMPISIAHKLRALKDGFFPSLKFRVVRAALTVDQVRAYGLPSTPLKDTERRADRWRERMGVEQTEIDALATLRPDVLEDIARQAIAPYYDPTVERRAADAKRKWQAMANERLAGVMEALDLTEANQAVSIAHAEVKAAHAEVEAAHARIKAVHDEAADFYDKLGERVDALRDVHSEHAQRLKNIATIEYPKIVLPELILPDAPPALVHSEMTLAEHIAILRAQKAYDET